MVQVRPATRDDAASIHALLVAAFTPFRPLYTQGCFDATVLDADRVAARITEGPVWVVEDGGRLMGTLGARQDGRGVYLRGLAVHPDARRLGVGRRLLETAEAFARSVDAPCLWLSTTPFLVGSIALYRSFGFEPGAEGPPDLFGTPLVSFEKRLA